MLSFFYMHKSGYWIKFAFPVSKTHWEESLQSVSDFMFSKHGGCTPRCVKGVKRPEMVKSHSWNFRSFNTQWFERKKQRILIVSLAHSKNWPFWFPLSSLFLSQKMGTRKDKIKQILGQKDTLHSNPY